MPIAGWPEERAETVQITDVADPILPTPFRIGETSAATVAAVGLAVSDLWELRTGRRQDVAGYIRPGTRPPRTHHHFTKGGGGGSPPRHPLLGFFLREAGPRR